VIISFIKFEVATAQLKFHSVTISITKEFTFSDIAKLGIELDHGAIITETSVHGIINDVLLDSLRNRNVQFTIDQFDLASFYADRIASEKQEENLSSTTNSKKFYGSMGYYFTLDEIYEIFSEIENKYPSLIRKDSIGVTFENRHIYAFHIGKDSVKNSLILPRTLITSVHHAREAITPTITCYFVQDFFEKVENQDPFCLFILNHSPITIIPCLNPDGYEYNRLTYPNGGGMWRKNRRIVPKTDGIGVDPNRNYGPKEFWDAPINGSSKDGEDETFRGDSAFSEAETWAIKTLHEKYNFKTALNFHSKGNMIVTPVSYEDKHPYDDKTFHYFCAHHTAKSRHPFGKVIQMLNYYVRGSSDDYLYLGTSKKVLSVTPEVGNSHDGFWPVRSQIFSHVNATIPSIYSAIRSTNGIPYFYSYSTSSSTSNFIDFTLEFVNTSLQPTQPCLLFYSKLNSNSQSQIVKATDTLSTISVGGSHSKMIQLTNLNSTPIFDTKEGIIIEQRYDSFSYFDTIYYNILKRTEYSLYNGEKTTNYTALKGWNIDADVPSDTRFLTESVRSNTRPESIFTTQTEHNISLEGFVDAYVEFDARWDFEVHSDGAIVFFHEKDSAVAIALQTERTTNFWNNFNPVFPVGTPYFNGRFQQRIVQRASLKQFLGRSGKIGFQVRSSYGITYDGFSLYKAKLVTFAPTITNLTETKNHSILVQDIYNALYFSISRGTKPLNPFIDFKIYTVNGAKVFSQQYEWDSQNYKGISIFKDVFPSGAYVVSITIDGQTIQETFTVVR